VRERVGPLLAALLWITLGGWIGAMTLFAAVVTPAIFRSASSPEQAGRLVGPILSAIHLYGIAAGVAIAALAHGMGRGLRVTLLALLLAAASAYSHFGVSAEIAELREEAFGANAEAHAQARWAELHRRSVWIFGVTGLGAVALAFLNAFEEARSRGAAGPASPRRMRSERPVSAQPSKFS
jgi:hypothetical protein